MKRGNIWFFPVLKTLGPHDAMAPIQQTTHLNKPLAQSRLAGHSLASRGIGILWDASSSGRRAGLALGSDTSAPNPGMGGKGDGDIGCHHPLVPLCLSRHQPHGKTSDLSEASLGLGFCKKKKNNPLVPIKSKWVNTGASASPKSPLYCREPAVPPTQWKGNQEAARRAGGPRPCSPLVAFQWGLLTPAGSTKLATLPRSASASPPQHPSEQCRRSRQHQAALPPGSLKRTPRLLYSRGKWPKAIQNLPCPSTHHSLPFCYLAPKGWKKPKTKTAKPKNQ